MTGKLAKRRSFTSGRLKEKKPKDVWTPLLRRTQDVPDDLSVAAPGHQYQVLEIIVARLAALLERGYTWSVSPLTGDGGIDFAGRRAFFQIPHLGVTPTSLILGQCKYRTSAINLITEFAGPLTKMCGDHSGLPSLIILVAVGKLTKYNKKEVDSLIRRFQSPVVVLSRDDVEYLISQYFRELDPLFVKYLSPEEYGDLSSYFARIREVATNSPIASVTLPRSADTGAPFDVVVRIAFERPCVTSLQLRWIPPWALGRREGATTLSQRLLAPAALAAPEGMMLDAPRQREIEQRLTFLSYGSGRRDMGKLLISSSDGLEACEIELGEVPVIERFHPPFFRRGVQRAFETLRSITTRAGPGLVGAVAIRGVGGSGKTRLCQEIGYDLIARGGEWISLSHPHTPDTPYALFRDLLVALTPRRSVLEGEGAKEAVMRHIARLTPALAEGVKPIIETLFEAAPATEHALGGRGRDALLRVLTILILLRADSGVLAIHLSDLHWADADGLAQISGLVDHLRSAQLADDASGAHRGTVVLLCEGRKGESASREAFLAGPDYSTHAWERFSALLLDSPVDVSELDTASSAALLKHWFENQESPHRRVRAELLQQQENDLFSAILAHGAGNPLYMIEYVILLIHEGLVKCNQRTGRFYLSRRIEGSLAPPETVAALIERRFRYVEEHAPGVAAVLRGMALIQDRVPRPLFERLRDAFLETPDEHAFLRTEMLLFPDGRVGDVRFRHETFFALLKTRPIPEDIRRKFVSVYLKWYDDAGDTTPLTAWRRGLVLEQDMHPDLRAIERTFRQALAGARTIEDNPLAEQALEGLSRLYPMLRADWGRMTADHVHCAAEIGYELACLRTRLAKWSQAQSDLEHLAELLQRNHVLQPLRLQVQIDLGNTLFHQLRQDEAVAVLNQVLGDLERAAVHGPDAEQSVNSDRWITACNRLGVAQWFSGAYEDAYGTLQRAYTAALDLRSPAQQLYRGIDVAALTIHIDPSKAFDLYGDLEMLERTVGSSKDRCLIACQKAIAGVARERARCDSGAALDPSVLSWASDLLEETYRTAGRVGYLNEQLWSALSLGVVNSIAKPESSIVWTAKALYLAFSAGNLEFLWMAHVNLAQICFQSGGAENRESAVLHATEALALLQEDFQRCRDTMRHHRIRVIAAAAFHIRRILSKATGTPLRTEYLGPLSPPWMRRSEEVMTTRWSLERAICLDVGDAHLYLMP